MPLEVELVAELGRVEISFSEMQSLKLGSLLDLGPSQPVEVKINDHLTLRGEPGESRGCHSIRVMEQVSHAPVLKLLEAMEDEPTQPAPAPPAPPESAPAQAPIVVEDVEEPPSNA